MTDVIRLDVLLRPAIFEWVLFMSNVIMAIVSVVNGGPGDQPGSGGYAVHRATGNDRDAGRILMAQQDHRRASVQRLDPDGSSSADGWWMRRWRRLG